MEQHKMYLVYFSLPDGKHLMAMNAHPSVIKAHAHAIISQNPDAKFDPNDIVEMTHPDQIAEAEAKLRSENPDRPLAGDLGLDSPNRILTNPEIARELATQQGISMSAGGGCC